MEVLLDTDTSQLILYRDFVQSTGDFNMERLRVDVANLPLIEKPEIKIYGKVCHQRRDVGFFSHPGVSGYRYSGQQTSVIDITDYPYLVDIMDKVNTTLNSNFNGILVNRYNDGNEYISAHSDSETGIDPVGVASISFGAARTFRIRDKKTKKIIYDIDHEEGDLLLMAGDFQKEFTHEVPIRKRVKEARTSLTFRCHKLV